MYFQRTYTMIGDDLKSSCLSTLHMPEWGELESVDFSRFCASNEKTLYIISLVQGGQRQLHILDDSLIIFLRTNETRQVRLVSLSTSKNYWPHQSRLSDDFIINIVWPQTRVCLVYPIDGKSWGHGYYFKTSKPLTFPKESRKSTLPSNLLKRIK